MIADAQVEYLNVQGKNIPFVRGTVPVEKCRLDPRNPRIQYVIGQRASGAVTEAELDAIMWEKEAVKALAQSIYQNGGVYEHIVVQRDGDNYIVREGNSRTVACRHLLENDPSDLRFQTLPAMIFDVELTAEDLAVLLADMHVAGKIRWDAYEQAKHVHDLSVIYGKTYDWLSNHLRLSKSKIQELLSAYRATTEYLDVHPGAENVKKFSIFQELMRKRELRDRFNNDLSFKGSLHQWLSQERITDSKQIRDLPLVLKNPEAVKALDKSGFEAANRILIDNDPALQSELFHAVKIATEKLRGTPASEIQDIAGNAQKIIMLRNLNRAIEDLATLANVKL
jgi:hypothetical protein